MKKLILKILPLLVVASCGVPQQSHSGNSAGSMKRPEAPKVLTLVGQFESKQGVMNNLGCYCFVTGILEAENGQSYDLCFDGLSDEIDCTSIKVTSVEVIKQSQPSSSNPCPSGERTFLQVQKYECQ